MKSLANTLQLRVLVFLLCALGTGVTLCYLHMQKTIGDNIQMQLQQAVKSLDTTLSHAEYASSQTKRYMGQPCTNEVQTSIRAIVATAPYVRTINLAHQDEIYCTSVFGGLTMKINMKEYSDHGLTLTKGNRITPSRPLVIYTSRDNTSNTAFIGIDGYYFYTVLKLLGDPAPLYLRIGNLMTGVNGHIVPYSSLNNAPYMPSSRYPYSVIADQHSIVTFPAFLLREAPLLIVITLVSALLTFLFRHYLLYHNTLEYMLIEAIKHHQLIPWIQPIIDSRSGQLTGGEILIRWQHPRQGFIEPDRFITVAEQTGLIQDVMICCFEEVIRQFSQDNKALPAGLIICFNTSPGNFRNEQILSLCRQFYEQLKERQFRLVLEITEREPFDTDTDLTDKLKQSGVQFALDDFGTGHANFRYIQQFRPLFIKIDKSFTQNIISCVASTQVVKNMVSLAESFQCQIIAEGIEERLQAEKLASMGVTHFQGYYFSRPLPIAMFMDRYSPDSTRSNQPE